MTHYLHTHLDLMAQSYFQLQSISKMGLSKAANTQAFAKSADEGIE